MRLWHLGLSDSWSNAPWAQDPPYGYLPGPSPVRILLLGGGAVAGFGVLTHQIGLLGHLSRQLATVTGRGVETEACAGAGMTLHKLVGRVQNLPAVRSGVVLVMVGVDDALRLTAPHLWKRDLQTLLDVLHSDAAEDVQVFLVAIPPLNHLQSLAPLPRFIAHWQSSLLNEATNLVCRDRDHVTQIPFPSHEYEGALIALTGGSESYYRWSTQLAPPLAAAINHAQQCRKENTGPKALRAKRALRRLHRTTNPNSSFQTTE
jgi:GDSL-like Lipase/Acylhydrolase family